MEKSKATEVSLKKEVGKMRKFLILGLISITLFLRGGAVSKSKKETPHLIVWTSYLLKSPFIELNKEFEKIYKCKIIYGRAPESTLAKAINKYDFSADVIVTRASTLKEAETLFRRIEEYKPLLESRWVIIYLKEKNLNVSSIEDLAKPGVRIGFCPKRTEYNDLSAVTVAKIVENAGIKEEFWKNIPEKVSCGGVCALVLNAVKAEYLDYDSMDRNSYYWQVYSHLLTQRADACIVDEIFTHLPEVKGKVRIVPIASKYIPSGSTTFSIGIVRYSKQKELAKKYIDFVFSKRGRRIFKKYGLNLIGR